MTKIKGLRKFLGNETFFDRKLWNVWRSEIFPFSAVVNFPFKMCPVASYKDITLRLHTFLSVCRLFPSVRLRLSVCFSIAKADTCPHYFIKWFWLVKCVGPTVFFRGNWQIPRFHHGKADEIPQLTAGTQLKFRGLIKSWINRSNACYEYELMNPSLFIH